MSRYVAKRLVWLIVVVVGMTLITFTITHMIPADPAKIAAGLGADASAVVKIRQELGLDLPLYQQYLFYLKNLFRGDLGRSILTNRPVLDDIKDYFPATLELAIVAMGVTMLLGVVLGVLSALKQGRVMDIAIRLFATLWVAMPVFWFALLLQILFYGKLQWLPPGARLNEAITPPPHVTGLLLVDSLIALRFDAFWSAAVHLILPVTAMAMTRVAEVARITRSSMLEVLRQDYIRTARAKGLAERVVTIHHSLRNAGLPILTTFGLQFGYLLGGTILVESIFQWPGMGRYAVLSITSVDFPAVMGVTVVASFAFVLVNLAVDLAYRLTDPRIRY
jgi:peptide/nickel transport system permease protein